MILLILFLVYLLIAAVAFWLDSAADSQHPNYKPYINMRDSLLWLPILVYLSFFKK